mgnify:CR=1 FL=1
MKQLDAIKVDHQVTDLIEKFSNAKNELIEAQKETENQINTNVTTGFWSGITGKTDKEISSQVKGLGNSLLNTQKVVMFLIELSHAKNEVLRGFHDALVDKLIELEKESSSITGDLSVSQQNEMKIVTKIKEEVESKLLMEKKIDDNYSFIKKNTERASNNENKIDQNNEHITRIKSALETKQDIDNQQSQVLQEHTKQIEELKFEIIHLKGVLSSTVKTGLIHSYGAIATLALIASVYSIFIVN